MAGPVLFLHAYPQVKTKSAFCNLVREDTNQVNSVKGQSGRVAA